MFELSSDLDLATACKAFEAIHVRNYAFRSRFVRVNEQVHSMVTSLPVAWQQAVSLENYKVNDFVTKVLP